MPQQKKYLATGFLVLTILIVIFLASGLSGVEFQPGLLVEENQQETILDAPQSHDHTIPLWYYLMIFSIWVILLASVFFFIRYPKFRKKLLQNLLYTCIYFFIIFTIARQVRETSPEIAETEQELLDTTLTQTQANAANLFASAAQVDPKVKLLLDIFILIVIALAIWYLYRRFFYKPPSTTDQLKAEIESALSELQSGVDLQNVIIRCYADMSQILNEQRGVQRQQDMTPREFERQLQEIGLPHAAIQRLTRLFEEVRYGNAKLGQEAEQEAIDCLSAIAEAC
jgi:hypothetical protein